MCKNMLAVSLFVLIEKVGSMQCDDVFDIDYRSRCLLIYNFAWSSVVSGYF